MRGKVPRGHFLERIENLVGVGIPDVLSIYSGAVSFVELKAAARPKRETSKLLGVHGLRPEQVNWHLRWHQFGGRSFVLTRDDAMGLYMLEGRLADSINDMSVATQRELSIASDWIQVFERLK